MQGRHGDLFVAYTVLFPKAVGAEAAMALREMFKGGEWQEAQEEQVHDEL